MRGLAASLSVLLLGAGCVAPTQHDDGKAGSAPLLASTSPLWDDPQNTPHPAWGWPTLSWPAVPAPSREWLPIQSRPLPQRIQGLEHVTHVDGLGLGAGIAVFGGIVVVPGDTQSDIVDIADPAAPRILSSFEPVQSSHRGAAIVAYPDGRLATAIATPLGFEVWDITKPTSPDLLAAVEPKQGGHKLGVVPGTPILYNAAALGGGDATLGLVGDVTQQAKGVTEIYDLTDPANPQHVQDFPNGYSCHHIFFWIKPGRERALCAGIEHAQIWDIADPRHPVVITDLPMPHGTAQVPSASALPGTTPYAHTAMLNAAGDVLIVGDEMGGGSNPPGCTADGAPTGALWFYDVSDETQPKLVGWFSPGYHGDTSDPTLSCTAHHGRLVPDPSGRDLAVFAFYGAGVVLIDFTDPSQPVMLDQAKGGYNTFEAWYDQGYVFTGDINRGMDVFTFR